MPPYEENLGDGLVLRSVRDERDIECYVTFHFDMFHNTECVTVDRLLRYHPEITFDDFLLVEDTSNGRIASTTCFVPWHCRYDEVELDVAQLEVVATHPDYRRRGLVRAQMRRFHQVAHERGFHLTAIGGIPYYYRQFGYTYTIDQAYGALVPPFAIPATDGPEPYRLRPPAMQDAPALTRLYEETMAPVQFHDRRSLEFWRYIVRWAHFPLHIIEDTRSRAVAGYVNATTLSGGAGFYVSESGVPSVEVAMAALRLLRAQSPGDIVVGGPESSTLARLARSLGAVSSGTYQWLLRIADLARFLERIGPVLERRLAASPFAGLTLDLRINTFREAVALSFREGKLAASQSLGFVDTSHGSDGGQMQFPPDAFVRLVMGHRSLEQLRDAWPDIVVSPELRLLPETLFPRMTSYLYLPYSYRGPVPDTAAGALSAAAQAETHAETQRGKGAKGNSG